MSAGADRLEIYVSRWKMAALLAFIAPPSLGALAAGILGGYVGAWIIGVPCCALSVLIAWQLVGAGRPYAIVDSSGITCQKLGLRHDYESKIAWVDVERLVCRAVQTQHRGHTSTGYFLVIYVRGERDWDPWFDKPRGPMGSISMGLSQMKGNSLELVEQVERLAGITIEHEQQRGGLQPELVRRSD